MKKIALIAIGAIVLMTSCKKDECTLSSSSIQGTYKVTAVTSQANAQAPVVDEYTISEPCEKDDLFVFGNGTFTSSEGATSCNPPTETFTANWTLAGSQLTLSVMGISISGTVESFNCNSMVFKVVDQTDNSITKVTYTRQ